MPDTPLAELRTLAEDLAVRAGTAALDGRRRLGVGQPVAHDTKSSPTDPVTQYDRAAEELIVSAIRRQRPDDAIVGEEGASHAGTSGFESHPSNAYLFCPVCHLLSTLFYVLNTFFYLAE